MVELGGLAKIINFVEERKSATYHMANPLAIITKNMKTILYIGILLLVCSCSKEKEYNEFLNYQEQKLDVEYKNINEEFSDKAEHFSDTYGFAYSEANKIALNINFILESVKKTNNLYPSLFQNIDSIFQLSDDLEENINKIEHEYWGSNYKLNQKITISDKQILSLMLKTVRNEKLIFRHKIVQKYDYTFPGVRPVILESSKTNKIGDKYTAKLGLVAFSNDTSVASFVMNDSVFHFDYGICNIEIPCNKKGEFTWQGILKFNSYGDNYVHKEYNIYENYIVK